MPLYEFEQVYDSVLGEATEDYRISEVEDAFAEGSFCATQYEIMWKAYRRVLDRTGQPSEDADVEIMRCALSAIQKELCRRMYQYGILFGRKTQYKEDGLFTQE